MAEKYYKNNVDQVALCEPYRFSSAGFSVCFKGDASLQAAGTDTTNRTLEGYTYRGNALQAIERGHCPSLAGTKIWSAAGGSSGVTSYNITRTDSALTIGDKTYTANNFSCKSIPKEVVILLVGAGGGGGGRSNKGYNGGAGGGGGTIVARLNLMANEERGYTISLGGQGTSAADGGRVAGSGTKGGDALLEPIGDDTQDVLWAQGGYGGSGGENDAYGGGGAGGDCGINPVFLINWMTIKGSKGDSHNDMGNTGKTAQYYYATNGTEDPGYTLCDWDRSYNLSNPGTFYLNDTKWAEGELIYPYSSQDVGGYYSGGCSHGNGAYPYMTKLTYNALPTVVGNLSYATSNVTIKEAGSAGGYGGGGGGGKIKSWGAPAYAAIYY